MTIVTLEEVRSIINNEFDALASKFNVYVLGISDAFETKEDGINKPGVYAYWHPRHGVILVGKSQSNSKKRALDHVRDNTKKGELEIASLKDDKDAKILLFNVTNRNDLHWILSLEAFMEWNLFPAIPAGRMG